MTDRIEEDCSLLKSDRLGRTRFTAEQRCAFLDAYEQGALSGPQFAKVHGLKYQTFASWRQKRQRQKEGVQTASTSVEPTFNLIEASLEVENSSPKTTAVSTLRISLSCGACLEVTDSSSARLAAELLDLLQSQNKGSC